MSSLASRSVHLSGDTVNLRFKLFLAASCGFLKLGLWGWAIKFLWKKIIVEIGIRQPTPIVIEVTPSLCTSTAPVAETNISVTANEAFITAISSGDLKACIRLACYSLKVNPVISFKWLALHLSVSYQDPNALQNKYIVHNYFPLSRHSGLMIFTVKFDIIHNLKLQNPHSQKKAALVSLAMIVHMANWVCKELTSAPFRSSAKSMTAALL